MNMKEPCNNPVSSSGVNVIFKPPRLVGSTQLHRKLFKQNLPSFAVFNAYMVLNDMTEGNVVELIDKSSLPDITASKCLLTLLH